MGYIKEPKGIDLVVGPSELTEADTTRIRLAISAYKSDKSKVGDHPARSVLHTGNRKYPKKLTRSKKLDI